MIYSLLLKNLAIADEEGVITINNLITGTLLYTLTHQGNQFKDLNQLRFVGPSHLYLCATSAKGTVYFYTKPLPSSHYNKQSSSNTYLCETLVK